MQIYLKEYSYETPCNVPYAREKAREDGSQNFGFMNVKKFPGQLKNIPELKKMPVLGDFVESVNAESNLSTYGCEYSANNLENQTEVWSYVNMNFEDDEMNKSKEHYLDLISRFIAHAKEDKIEFAVVEFIINPTQFHDREKVKKGAKPSEKTVLYQGWSLNIKVTGFAETLELAMGSWMHGILFMKKFLTGGTDDND